jgi:hypothetical protein
LLDHIWRGFDPMAYNTDKKPDWYVFLNMMEGLAV